MDKRLVGLIERAVKSDRDFFPLNAGWRTLHGEYNVGNPSGNKIRLSPQDKDELVELVKQMTGLDLRAGSVAELSGAGRAEALTRVRDEKWAGRAVSAGRLALKALPGEPLRLNGGTLALFECSHLDMSAQAIRSLAHDAILVVENYECFDRLHRIRLALEGAYTAPLVVHRGDPNSGRADDVNGFLGSRQLPVLAMVDMDPAGLLIAQTLPNVAGLVAPALAELEILLVQGNPELYHRQRPVAQAALSNSPHGLIRRLWEMMERSQRGLVQERWLQGDVVLRVHPF